ncbi:hypothetical protein ACWEPH_26760 [Nocardia beijingensis]
MTGFLRDTTTVTQWLDIHRDQLYTELGERLDIAAGLEEVFLTERHHDLVENIQENLDIEGGLAAILPAPPVLVSEDQPPMRGSLEWASDALARMPLQARLTLRADYAAKLGFAAREAFALGADLVTPGGFDEVAGRIRELLDSRRSPYTQRWKGDSFTQLWREVRNRVVHWHGVSAPSDELRDLVAFVESRSDPADEEIVELLREVLARPEPSSVEAELAKLLAAHLNARSAAEVPFARDPAVQEWKAAVADYVSAMLASGRSEVIPQIVDGVLQMDRAIEHVQAVADHLAFLEQILNDFVGADLRQVELQGVSLEGLRWSDRTTQWPEDWRERITQDSVHIGADVYEVHHGTHARGRNTLV